MEKIYIECDRVILISDVHMGCRAASVEWTDNITSYFHGWFLPLLRKMVSDGVTPCVFVAGDFFDNRDHMDIGVMNIAKDIISEMSEICHIVMMAGNHDMYKRMGGDITSLVLFDGMENVDVVKNPSIIKTTKCGDYLMVPWTGDMKEMTSVVSLNSKDVDAIILHADISGMHYDNGREIVDGVSLKGCTKPVFSGHIHKRQENKKCTYIGSPYHLSRSDIGNDKGVYFLYKKDGKNGSKLVLDFVLNDFSPKFVRVMYSDLISLPSETLDSMIRKNYVDIVFTERKEVASVSVQSVMDKAVSYNPKMVTVVNEAPAVDVEKEVSIISSDNELEDAMDEYMKASGLSDVDSEKLNELNIKYIAMARKELGV